MPAVGWELEHGAILSDDHVEARQVSRDVMEIEQPASRDQDDHDSAPPRLADRVAYSRVEHAVHGDRAVIVEGKGRELHDSDISSVPVALGFRRPTAGFPARTQRQ